MKKIKLTSFFFICACLVSAQISAQVLADPGTDPLSGIDTLSEMGSQPANSINDIAMEPAAKTSQLAYDYHLFATNTLHYFYKQIEAQKGKK
jgi:hypothetical protein